MIQHVVYLYRFNLNVAARLVGDLTPQQMVEQPAGVVNHPAWSLGHLAMTSNRLAGMFGLGVASPRGMAADLRHRRGSLGRPVPLSVQGGAAILPDRAA